MSPLDKVQTSAEYHRLVVRLRAAKRAQPATEDVRRSTRKGRVRRAQKGVPPHGN